MQTSANLAAKVMLLKFAQRSVAARRVHSMQLARLIGRGTKSFCPTRKNVCTATLVQVYKPRTSSNLTRSPYVLNNRALSSLYAVSLNTTEDVPEPGTPEAPPQIPPAPVGESNVEVLVTDGADLTKSSAGASFSDSWALFEQFLVSQGEDLSEPGLLKKACMNIARSRPEAIYMLSPQSIAGVASCSIEESKSIETSPLKDRKIFNALKRLQGSYNLGPEVGISDGGEASFQDLVRVLSALQLHRVEHGSLQKETEAAAEPCLAEMLRILKSEPTPEAQAKLAEAEMQRAREAEKVAAERERKETERRSKYSSGSDRFLGRTAYSSNSFGRQQQQPYGEPSETGSNFRPGDWLCPSCSFHNYASKTSCYRCSEPKPEGAEIGSGGDFSRQPAAMGSRSRSPGFNDRSQGFSDRSNRGFQSDPQPGDWACPTCGSNNFARRTECFKCSTPRADSGGSSGFSRGGAPSRGPPRIMRENDRGMARSSMPMKQGDWNCPDCGAHNFASRSECFKCRAPKSIGASSGGAPSSFGGSPPPSAPMVKQGDWTCSDCGAHNFASRSECFRCRASKQPGTEMTPTSWGRSDSYGGGGGGRGGRQSSQSTGQGNEWYGGPKDRSPSRGPPSRGMPPPATDIDW